MLSLLNRFALLLSLTIGYLVAYFFAELFSGSYSNASENFLSGWWILCIIVTIFVKRVFLSESFISTHLDQKELNFVSNTPYVVPPEDTAFIDDISQNQTEYVSVENESMPEVIQEISSIPPEPEKPNWIIEFFSDRPLAKIGGILLFLGALFFLSLVWAGVGNVGKIIIGIGFGMFLYAMGIWMDHRGHTIESRSLLGVGIAVNTLTILAGRWILKDQFSGDAQIVDSIATMSDLMTLVFLILNVVLGVVTGLVYQSRNFLIFSYVLGFASPLLTGGHADGPFLLLAYTVIMVWSGLFIASHQKNTRPNDAHWLFMTNIVGSTILLFIASFAVSRGNSIELLTYISLLFLIIVPCLMVDMRQFAGKYMNAIVIGGYIGLFSLIFSLGGATDPIVLMLGSIALFAFVVWHILVFGVMSISAGLLFVPLVLAFSAICFIGTGSLIIILPLILLAYGIAIFFLFDTLAGGLQIAFFAILGLFLTLVSGFSLQQMGSLDISGDERGIIVLSELFLFGTSLYFSLRKKVHTIMIAMTVMTILSFMPVLRAGWEYAWTTLIVFSFLVLVGPYIQKFFLKAKASYLQVIQTAILAVFVVLEIAYLGKDFWFSGTSNSLVTLGFIYLALSIGSCIYTYILMEKESMETQNINISLSFLAIPLSLFSLAVAVIFSHTPAVVASVWIIESAVLAFLYGRIGHRGILIGATILLVIGGIQTQLFFDVLQKRDWLMLLPLAIIAISLFIASRSIPSKNAPLHFLYDVFSGLILAATLLGVMQIIPSTSTGWSLLGLSLGAFIIQIGYKKIQRTFIQFIRSGIIVIFYGVFFLKLPSLDIDFSNILALFVQLLSLATVGVFTWILYGSTKSGSLIRAGSIVSTLIITSIYIQELTSNGFAVTIYNTIIATVLIFSGIARDIPGMRTAGLYIGIFVLAKILMYDIWTNVDNLIVRVIALMVAGGSMIGLSQLYGRNVNRSWSDELSLSNFHLSENSAEVRIDEETEKIPFSDDIAGELKKVDIQNIASIVFLSHDGTRCEMKNASIKRLAKYVITRLRKTHFASNELQATYNNIVPHIQSALPKQSLDAILADIAYWIEQGGEIIIQEKS